MKVIENCEISWEGKTGIRTEKNAKIFIYCDGDYDDEGGLSILPFCIDVVVNGKLVSSILKRKLHSVKIDGKTLRRMMVAHSPLIFY